MHCLTYYFILRVLFRPLFSIPLSLLLSESHIPDFVQTIILHTLQPVTWTRSVVVFAVPEAGTSRIMIPFDGPPVAIRLTPVLSSSSAVAFIQRTRRDIRSAIQPKHYAHPSWNQAILIIEVDGSLPDCDAKLIWNKPQVNVAQLRIIVSTFLHPTFLREPEQDVSVMDYAISSNLANFDLSVSGRYPLPGQTLHSLQCDDAVPLIQGSSEHWTVEQLVHLVHGSEQNGFEPLVLFIRPRSLHGVPPMEAAKVNLEEEFTKSISGRSFGLSESSFLAVLSECGVIRALADCTAYLFHSRCSVNESVRFSTVSHQPTVAQPSHLELMKQDFTCPTPVCPTVLQNWLHYLSKVRVSYFSLDRPKFPLVPRLLTKISKPDYTSVASESSLVQNTPMCGMLVFLLLLPLDGYAESLADVTNHFTDGTDSKPSAAASTCEMSNVFLIDLVKSILKLAQPLPLQQLINATATANTRQKDTIKTTQLIESPAEWSLRHLLFQALNQLCDRWVADEAKPVQLFVRQHLENGVLDLILSFLSTVTLRLNRSPNSSFLLPDRVSLILAARLEFERELSSLTDSALRKSDETRYSMGFPNQSSHMAKGTGFASGCSESRWNAGTIRIKSAQEDNDAIVLLHVLTTFFKTLIHRPRQGDTGVEVAELSNYVHLISRTLARYDFVRVLIAYLRNESALDLDNRVPLYRTLVLLIRVIVHLPAFHWILVTGSTYVESELQAIITECSQLDTRWSYLEAVDSEDTEITQDCDALLETLPRDCPARLINQILQILTIYETQLR